MLKIERVEILGFKSFCDRTDVHLPEGITAVVGPNGCGKSNIGDAIHWALGEQSARTLRGGRMEDVIFAGTESRGPHGMVEVSIHLQSNNGDAGSDGRTVITRRLFRSGDGEYLINGKKSRLRDIQEMLQAAHVGATSYAVIEQGKVDAILNAKPRERRHLIEEAAGITGYKQKRHLAELKLMATEANLQRIHDVILEVGRQIQSLKRQAARARRYSRMREELRGLEARGFAARARMVEADARAARETLKGAQTREAECAAGLGRAEAESASRRDARRAREAETLAARDTLHRISREIDAVESTMREEGQRAEEARLEAARLADEIQEVSEARDASQRERAAREDALAGIEAELAAIEGELATLATNEAAIRAREAALAAVMDSQRTEQVGDASRLAELANTQSHIEKEISRLDQRAARLAEEERLAKDDAGRAAARAEDAAREARAAAEARDEASGRCDASKRELTATEEQARAIADTIARERESLARLEERVRALEDVEVRLAGVGSGARFLLTRNGGGPVRGLVADFLEVGSEAEPAVEGCLGDLLAAVVVPSSESALSLVSDLNDASAGRCLFVPEDVGPTPGMEAELPRELARQPGVLGLVSGLASTTNGIAGILARRLSGAVLAKDLAAAVALAAKFPDRDYVTPGGEIVRRDGTIEGGRGSSAEHGLLTRRRLLEATRTERAAAETSLARCEAMRLSAEEGRRDAVANMDRHDAALKEAERQATLAVERAGTLAVERDREGRRGAVVREEIAALEEERQQVVERLAGARAERESLEATLARTEARLAEQRDELVRARAAAQALAEQIADRKQARAAIRERRAHTSEESERLTSEITSLDDRIERGRVRKEELESRSRNAEGAARAASERLAEEMAGRARAAEALAGLEESLRAGDEEAAALEEEVRRRRAELEQVREERSGAERAAAVGESDLRHLDERSRVELDEDLGSVLGRIPEEPDLDLAAVEGECAQMRSKLEAMGPVNLLAIEEYRELETRHEFFLAQEKDLTSSMESLKETIRRINRSSRERFLEAFERIRENFRETFRLLFAGGRADIRLMEDEDPLECGLEITVQPPGKRLQSLSLLSGGEKALSAIALLFAIFRYQPSPFCLLDEVDAALDESNVRRFTRLLKEFSLETQFIVITHNKRSMEIADTLYGVTMEEPGISRLVSMILADGRPVRAA